MDYGEAANTFELTLEDTSGVIATGSSGTSSHGLYLEATLAEGETYSLHVEASSGSGHYRLRTREALPAPVLTSATPSSGVPGDSVALAGTDLGTTTDGQLVLFGGVAASVTAASGTTLTVEVPENAPDGDIVVCRSGGCSDGVAFTTGTSTLSASSWSRPTASSWSAVPGVGGVYMSRILLSLPPDGVAADADAIMADALTSLPALDAYTQSGFIPYRNDYQFSLTWASGSDAEDYVALLAWLDTDGRIDGILPEGKVSWLEVVDGHDVGFGWSGVQDEVAAYDVIGVEETWRLLANCCSEQEFGAVRVAVLDSGLRNRPAPEGTAQFLATNVNYFQRDGANKMQEIGLPGANDNSAQNPSHGTAVLSILAARDNGVPVWNGTAAANRGGAGILAGVNQWGVNDDGDVNGSDGADSNGETFPFMVDFYNTVRAVNTGAGSLASLDVYVGLIGMIEMWTSGTENLPPNIVSLSVGLSPLACSESENVRNGLRQAFENLPLVLFVAAAGNESVGSGDPTVVDRNCLALAVDSWARHHLVVAGSDPGGTSSADDDEKLETVDGPEVDLAAPSRVRVLQDHTPPSGVVSWGDRTGTSFAAPQVAATAALIVATSAAPSGSVYALDAADARAIILDHLVPISAYWGGTRLRLDLFGSVLAAVETGDLLDTSVRVCVADRGTSTLYSQEIDPSTGIFEGSSAESVDLSANCSTVGAVEVDPLGDLVYVLCLDSAASFLVVNAYTLQFLAEVALAGTVGSEAEMAVTQEGLVVVTSVSGTDAVTQVWDPYDGGLLAQATTISGSVAAITGADAHPFRPLVGISSTDPYPTNGAGEQVAILEVDAYNRTSATDALAVTSATPPSTVPVDLVRDVEWNPGDDTLDVTFRDGSAGKYETLETDETGALLAYGYVDDEDEVWAITTDPTGNTSKAYLAGYDTQDLLMVDADDPPDWAVQASYGPPGTSASWSLRTAEFAQNGKFVVAGYAGSGSTTSLYVYAVPHDPTAAGAFSIVSAGDPLSQATLRPWGTAVAPVLSILSPRPGKELSAVHRVHVVVRDPAIETISYTVDGAPVDACPDDSMLDDGLSDSCLLATKSWTDADEHVLRVTATYSDASTFYVEGRY